MILIFYPPDCRDFLAFLGLQVLLKVEKSLIKATCMEITLYLKELQYVN